MHLIVTQQKCVAIRYYTAAWSVVLHHQLRLYYPRLYTCTRLGSFSLCWLSGQSSLTTVAGVTVTQSNGIPIVQSLCSFDTLNQT